MEYGLESGSDSMCRRLARLERSNRRWKLLATSALALLGLALFLGAKRADRQPVADELRTRALLLVDEQGTPLARLGRLPHGALGLGFYDDGRRSRILLSVNEDGTSSLNLFSKGGRSGALLSASRTGGASLRLLDGNWKNRATVATWPNGSPFLRFADHNGRDRILLGSTELKVTPSGELVERSAPRVLFFDADESILWQAP
ncbi:MAG: hypothetical protein OXP66_19230 [Candidatus Tectomicrobia bacterium]|nr:hypothetical protein [Candidatus Tectomicrobia bacterium]